MTIDTVHHISRKQIQKWVGNDQDSIKAIEKLFKIAGNEVPDNVNELNQSIEDSNINDGQTLALISELQASLQKQRKDIINIQSALDFNVSPFYEFVASQELGVEPITG